MKIDVGGDPARALWMLCALVLAATYAIAIHPMQSAIAGAQGRTALLAEHTFAEQRALRHMARIRRVHAALQRDLRAVRIPHSLGESAAALLVALTTAAAVHRVEITSVQPRSVTPASAVRPALAKVQNTPNFDSVDIVAHGTYDDMIQFIRASSLTTTPARVEGVNLKRTRDTGSQVEATIHLDALRPIEGEYGG